MDHLYWGSDSNGAKSHRRGKQGTTESVIGVAGQTIQNVGGRDGSRPGRLRRKVNARWDGAIRCRWESSIQVGGLFATNITRVYNTLRLNQQHMALMSYLEIRRNWGKEC